jgi:hypothetical protein
VSDLRCWQCGVEPIGLADVRTYGDPGPVLIPTGWPAGDHEHAVTPPTPIELQAGGDRALARIMEEWAK